MERGLVNGVRLEDKSERADLYHISGPDTAPVLDSPTVDPGAVATLQFLDDESFRLHEYETVAPGDHGVHEAQVAFLVAAYGGSMAGKFLLHLLAVRSENG
jgi:hypothetical protein